MVDLDEILDVLEVMYIAKLFKPLLLFWAQHGKKDHVPNIALNKADSSGQAIRR